ncbi:hypothetical protein Clacol_005678 [Clathrus columnatus]|uniref:AB hydrolase-1 domain-containing protein n=1 Tax=Clathrus columnatus TaxID=1419009 RepID=A0AAV5AAS9_9AGAM|nr:hypothetical protein Clacol_005678 [Clathrus columnatus]
MALVYNQPRFSQRLLERYKQSPASFSIDYYDDHWLLNKGHAKFLYTQPLSALLDDVNALRIPVDFIEIFDSANVPYYEGCMIVETIDHRKPRTHHQQSSNKEPESVRVVLHPNDETLYADLCLLNAKYGNTWTDMDALEIEAKTLTAITPSLHLDPDPNYARIVNSVIRATTSPETVLRKRKQDQEPEENENEKAKRAKLWSQYMHPRHGKQSISQKRSLFDILGDIATKDQKGTYKLKNDKPARPLKREPVANAQPPTLLPGPSQPEASSLPSVAVATTSAAPLQDESKIRAPATTAVPKLVPEVPLMTNGKTKPPITAASPIVPSPISDQRASVPPAVNRTPVVTGAALASSPTPAPQYPPAASPRPPSLPGSVPQVPNKPKPAPPAPAVPPVKSDDYHSPVPGVQAAPSHPQPPTAIPVIPPNLPPGVSAQWHRYIAAQKQAQLQHPRFQQQQLGPQAQVKPPQPHPQTQPPLPPHPHPQSQPQQQPQSQQQQSLSQQQPQPQSQPPSQPQPQPQPQPQSQLQQQPQPQSQSQPQTQTQTPKQASTQLSQPQPQPQLQSLAQQSQRKQPTPHPPQAAAAHPSQAPMPPGVANHSGHHQNLYKAAGVVAQTPSPNRQRSSPLAHPPQQAIPPHAQNSHLPAQPQPSVASTQAPSHPVPHANQWSLQQQQQAARYLQGQQAAAAAAAGHHPQVMPQHGHPVVQPHLPQQQNMPRPTQGHDPSQQAMMHAQMQYNPMYSYQAMHAAGMMNGMRMPANAAAQNPNAQYMAQAQAWRAGRGGPVPINAQYLHAAQQQQAQLLAAMRAHQQQQQQQQPIQQQAQGLPSSSPKLSIPDRSLTWFIHIRKLVIQTNGDAANADPDKSYDTSCRSKNPVRRLWIDKITNNHLYNEVGSLYAVYQTRASTPLDYFNVSAGVAKVALGRYKAKRSPRKGSGPGASGKTWVTQMGTSFQAFMSENYDIVGFDPRGIGKTEPGVKCFRPQDLSPFGVNSVWQTGFDTAPDVFDPRTREHLIIQQREANALSKTAMEVCKNTMGDTLRYMGTSTIARDVDFITTILEGQDALINYWGVSYGSVLGSYIAYVLRFPDRIGRVVIDGIAHAGAWANIPGYKFYRQWLVNADETYNLFFKECSKAGCTLAKHIDEEPDLIKARVDDFLNELYLQPMSAPGANRPGILKRGMVDRELSFHSPRTRAALLNTSESIFSTLQYPLAWPNIAVYLQEAMNGNATILTSQHQRFGNTLPSNGVACNDNPAVEPPTAEEMVEEGLYVLQNISRFAYAVASTEPETVGCQYWPVTPPERFRGPWNHTLRNPILVISNELDPITPLDSGRWIRGQLGDSARLVIREGPGHTSITLPSICVGKTIKKYFLKGVLPPDEYFCPVDASIFLSGESPIRNRSLSDDDKYLLDKLYDLCEYLTRWSRWPIDPSWRG